MGSAVAHALVRSHLTQLCITEIAEPTAIRREVCFSEAVYDGEKTVEGVTARLAECPSELKVLWEDGIIPVVIDSDACIRKDLHPDVLVDAILAKRNLGTHADQAMLVVGLGPGFYAGRDVHAVIETNRGHNLGRIILSGEAEQDTGKAASIGTIGDERVLRASEDGVLSNRLQIGDFVQAGESVGAVEGIAIESKISGVLRGLIRPGIKVTRGLKIGDVDPRGKKEHCYAISDKGRAVAGGVVQAILMHFNK